MDVYRGKKVLLESGALHPACVLVQNGKILQVHESYEIPLDLKENRQVKINLLSTGYEKWYNAYTAFSI